MLLVPCNRKSGYDDLGCVGLQDRSALILRIIKWKVLHLTWNKGGPKESKEICFSKLCSSCVLSFAFLLHMALHFSNHVKFTSVILCTVTGAEVFACKYLGEVSVATSIYVFKSLILFADELMFCSWTAAELICGKFFLASSEAAWPFLFGVEKTLINTDFFFPPASPDSSLLLRPGKGKKDFLPPPNRC